MRSDFRRLTEATRCEEGTGGQRLVALDQGETSLEVDVAVESIKIYRLGDDDDDEEGQMSANHLLRAPPRVVPTRTCLFRLKGEKTLLPVVLRRLPSPVCCLPFAEASRRTAVLFGSSCWHHVAQWRNAIKGSEGEFVGSFAWEGIWPADEIAGR